MSGFVDFDDVEEEVKSIDESHLTENLDKDIKMVSLYKRNGKSAMFNDKTMLYYTALRKTCTDPFTLDEVNNEIAFKFSKQWDPANGQRLEDDPYGPLCFHPDSLIKYFHTNRLNGLWENEKETNGVYYQGYYDSFVG